MIRMAVTRWWNGLALTLPWIRISVLDTNRWPAWGTNVRDVRIYLCVEIVWWRWRRWE